MVSSNSFFTILILSSFYVFPLLAESSPKYPKLEVRGGLAKRVQPEDIMCGEGEEWEERRCDGEINELVWVDYCWNPQTDELNEYPNECEGGYICTDKTDDDDDNIIECINSAGDIVDPQPGAEEGDAEGNWVDGDDEDDEGWGEDFWGGQVIDIGGGVAPNPGDQGVPYEVVRFMNRTVMAASVTAALLSHSEDFIVLPHTPLTVTRGNLNVPLCTYNATRRRCEPSKQHKLDLWHGDRITITFSLLKTQAVFLVFTYFGPKAHAPPKHARLLLDRETD